jgi:hypothetical protein
MSIDVSEEFYAPFFRTEEGYSCEVCYLKVLKNMRVVQHSYESVGGAPQIGVPPECLIEF